MNILMTVEELAKYLKIKPDTIYKKVRKGELPAIKLGKVLRFPKELIDQWIEEQSQRTLKATAALTNRVEEVVDEAAKKAREASKVLNHDVADILDDLKKAALADKPDVLKKGLQDLWVDLNKSLTEKKAKARKSGASKKVSAAKGTKKKAVGAKKRAGSVKKKPQNPEVVPASDTAALSGTTA